jgi:hypothetical protein
MRMLRLRLYPSSDPPSIAAQARGARAQVERALDRVAWRWSRSLCFAGCSPSAVLAALGLRMADLFEAPLLRDPLTLAAFARAKQLPVENPPEDVDGPEAAGGTP